MTGGQSQMVFRMAKTPENAAYYDRLVKAEKDWQVEFCYCSVFEDCWIARGKWTEPQKIKECRRDEPTEFIPQGGKAG